MSEEKAFCRTDDLAIGYGKTPLMEHIRLGAEKGSILTLIGPNGAGKSTLLKTLAAQLAPQGGAVLLDGKSLADYSGPERARKMALMVPLGGGQAAGPRRAGSRGGRSAGGTGLQLHQ